jgi:hypothetical protein
MGIAAHSRPDQPSTWRDLGDGVRHVIDVMQAHVRYGKIKGPSRNGTSVASASTTRAALA